MKKSVHNAEHYFWGEQCSGWQLVQSEGLSVIQELMPAATKEQKHFHSRAQQFFYILKGTATFEIEGAVERVEAFCGLHIKAGIWHQIRNESGEELHFLVISQPSSRGDRTNVGEQIKPEVHLHNKFFTSISNTENGEVGEGTLFHYRQEGKTIWATYKGGGIVFGTLSGKMNENGLLEFHYQHRNLRDEWMSGSCLSSPEILEDGRIRLHEKWQWSSGDRSKGESVIEEMAG